ncbi:hypothetical protein [Mycolicibacterium peregrinum]|uniref:hypothetical protein n=1 Tax=Mycolicibacterium peregrinum TaxID=43304 RepID=UPI00146D0A1B|nr:hypothetical protein [Mycolicibacterium peregrinum]
MSEARDKVAEAICGTTSAGRLFPWAAQRESEREQWRRMADAAVAAHLVELGQGGYVVVALPEPDGPLGSVSGEPRGMAWRRDTNPGERGGIATVALQDCGDLLAHISCLRTADDARWAAAALLAAAEKAEASE